MEVTVKTVPPVSSHFEQIEAIVDQSSVDQLILKLSRICYEKSEHIESAWQDKQAARVWRRAMTAHGDRNYWRQHDRP